jgi:NADH:ubiquinone oxidoreductase subunit E
MRKLTHPDHLAEWRTKILEDRPTRKKTIVVTSGTCGQASGSLQVLDALRQEIDKRGLADTVGIEVTGCHGFCEMEPSLIIYPQGWPPRTFPRSSRRPSSKTRSFRR